jgi:predicted RND superfamily exporter protein
MKAAHKKRHHRMTVASTPPEQQTEWLTLVRDCCGSSADHQPDSAQEERYAEIDQHFERKEQLKDHLGLLDDPEFHQRHQELAEQLKQRHGISIHQFSELVRIWEYEEEERRANEKLAMAEAYLRNANKRSFNPPATLITA